MPASDGGPVLCVLRRAPRAVDNPALDVAISAANVLARSVAVVLQAPLSDDAIGELRDRLRTRSVGLLLDRAERPLEQLVADLRPSLVVADVLVSSAAPLWLVDAESLVPRSLLLGSAQARQRYLELLPKFVVPLHEPTAHRFFRGAEVGNPALSRRPERALREAVTSGLGEAALSSLRDYLERGLLGPRQVALALRGAVSEATRQRALHQLIVEPELARLCPPRPALSLCAARSA